MFLLLPLLLLLPLVVVIIIIIIITIIKIENPLLFYLQYIIVYKDMMSINTYKFQITNSRTSSKSRQMLSYYQITSK